MHLHACLLALRHRAPGEDGLRAARSRSSATSTATRRGWSTSTPRRRTGGCVRVRARLRARRRRLRVELHGRRSPTRRRSPAGPTPSPTRGSTATVAYTNNPPSGAMRGFGAAAGRDRLRGADGPARGRARPRPAGAARCATRCTTRRRDCRPASACPGPVGRGRAARRRCARCRCPARRAHGPARAGPAGRSAPRDGEGVRRGVGYALRLQEHRLLRGLRRLRRRPRARSCWCEDGAPVAEVHTAATEVGQGVLGVHEQIVRTELGVERRARAARPTRAIGSAGSASARG